MRKWIVLVFTISISILIANPVSYKTAKFVAQNWYKNYSPSKNVSATIKEYFATDYKGKISFYTFVFDEGGWVNISADDITLPILGYSFYSQNYIDNKNSAYNNWMSNYGSQIEFALKNKFSNEKNTLEWENLKQNKFLKNEIKGYGPLLVNHNNEEYAWGQDWFFDDFCPVTSNNDTTLVGCVATAMSMIMRFHQFPYHGMGTVTYDWDCDDINPFTNEELYANFENASYYWDKMPVSAYELFNDSLISNPDLFSEMKLMIAELARDCGYSVEMDYGVNGSGIDLDNFSDIRTSFVDNFKYSTEATALLKSDYPDENVWKNMIRNNINLRKPILYAGMNDSTNNGHAFVCDGYDDQDKFHFNWGWYSGHNGFFPLNALSVDTVFNYTDYQRAVFNIYPSLIPYTCINQTLNKYSFDKGEIANYSVSIFEDSLLTLPAYNYDVKLRIENSIGGLINIVEATQIDTTSADYEATFSVPQLPGNYRILLQLYSKNLIEKQLLAAGDLLYFDVIQNSGAPENIQISHNGSTVELQWNSVEDVDQYYIYGMNEPYSSPVFLDSTANTVWVTTEMFDKYFYEITTVNYTSPIPEGMVLIPGGTFTMGDHFSEGYSGELPLHSITVSDFYMGATEVTQAEWSAYMPAENWSSYGTGDTYPAYYVSWYEIIKYCNLRSMAEGLTPCYTISSSTDPADWGTVPTSSNSTWNAAICNWSANGYRLPTEAEWEYAARGGLDGQRFPNGETISHSTNGDTQANYYGSTSYSYDVSPTTGYHPDYNGTSSPVGTFPANGYGLYDMSGNLWEWCWDWYGSSYYTTCNDLGTVTNPEGPTSGSYRVGRGGRWRVDASYCRVAYRYNNVGYPYNSYSGVGFRVSRTP